MPEPRRQHCGDRPPLPVFDVYLVDNSSARRDHFEVFESGLTPTEELVALSISLVFELNVFAQGVFVTEKVGDDRVVDDQLSR